MFQIFLMKKKKKKRKKTTYRRDSRLAQPLAGKHPAHPPLSLVPEIDKNIEYRGTISATFCPTGGWNGGSTRYWKLQELYLVYTETREGGADNKGERGGDEGGKNNTEKEKMEDEEENRLRKPKMKD